MPASEPVEIRRLDADEVRTHLDGLAAVLADCVAGGASVSYMAPFTEADARAAFDRVGRRGGVVDGGWSWPRSSTESRRHRPGRRREAAEPAAPRGRRQAARAPVGAPPRGRRLLMERAEREARSEGKTLLVLDTVTGDDAERLYTRLGWTRVGVIPNYALYPDGRSCDTTVFWKAV